MTEKEKYQFEELSNKVIGAAIKVHKELGPGFLENIYEEALKIELSANAIHYDSQKEIKIEYPGVKVGVHRIDLIAENEIILGLQSVKNLADIHFIRIRSCLEATGLKLGLLLNFAKPVLKIKRVVN